MTQQKKKPGRPPGSKNKNTGQKKQTTEKAEKRGMDPHVKDEIWAIIIIAAGAFLAVAFQTHAAGAVGEGLSQFFKGCLGMIAYALPYYLILYGILLFARKTIHIGRKSVLLLFVILLTVSIINSARFIDTQMLGFDLEDISDYYTAGMKLDSGGLVGMYIGSLLAKAFGIPGLYIISSVIIIICLLLIINTPISRFFERAAEKRRKKKEAELLEEMEEDYQDLELFSEMEKASTTKTLPPSQPLEQETKTVTEKKRRTPLRELFQDQGVQQQMDLSNQQGSSESSYVPGRISEGQRNILEYLKSDDLFGKSGQDSFQDDLSYGLKENKETSSNYEVSHYGMEPSFGLDGHSLEPEEGMGLSDTFNGFEDYQEESPDQGVRLGLDPDVKEEESHFKEKKEEKGVSDAPAAAAVYKTAEPHKEPEKMTNSQAAKASLSPEDLQETAVPAVYKFPPIDLLNKGQAPKNRTGVSAALQAKARKLEETLENFHIDAKVVQVTQGPAVTRYEIHPNVGVKVKSIVNLADDIALNLEAKSIRIEAPIPGKAAVGIEVENDKVNMVTLREIIDSKEFKSAQSKITFAVGKDIAGNAIVANMKSMPHLLIAGSTGSGKSVCVNSIINSVLYKARPEEVKLVLIDPKVVELTNYNGIPHLLIPVVTEPTKAAAALNWAVAEMEDRYKRFAEEKVRELASYNDVVKKRGEDDKFLPQIIIIIDELADLMMAAPSQVEDSICRLAQKARAAGMHLIVATQRPSVDVITGVIKANIPSRIAFAVSSQFDSRTILGIAGAERLVGKGDMLFHPMGSNKPIRVQGTFISDSEVESVIDFVKSQVEETEYSDDVIHTIEKSGAPDDPGDTDELLVDAIETVVSAGQASVSMLQRRFRIGYNRAARIVDMMEARGIIGPSEGSKPRQVLMTEEELHALTEDTEDLQEG